MKNKIDLGKNKKMKAIRLKWILQCLLIAVLGYVSHKVGSYGGSMGQILFQTFYSYLAIVAVSITLGDISLYTGQRFSILAAVAGIFGGAVAFFVSLFLNELLGRFVPYLPMVFWAIPIIVPVVTYNGITSWRRRNLSEKKKRKMAVVTVTNCIWITVVICISFLAWCHVAKPSFYYWLSRKKVPSSEEAMNGLTGAIKSRQKEETDINAKGFGDKQALHVAVMFDNAKTVKKLIENGADVNAQNKDGNTALACALFRANPEVVELLLSAGADPNIKNNKGVSVLDTATEMLDGSGPKFPARMEGCARLIVEHVGKNID